MLLAKDENPIRWDEEVKVMEAHMLARKESSPDSWEAEKVNVVDFIRNGCKLADKYDSELIHRVCGILEVNCFEIKTQNGVFIRGLYPLSAILSHNCVSNTTHSITSDNYRIKLRTTVDVKEGEELFTSYTSAILPTFIRRENLSYSKYFGCTCARCSDPTELGTHLSSLKCTKCDDGIIISSDSLNPEAFWKCTHCIFMIRAEALKRIYSLMQCEVNRLDTLDSSDLVIEHAEKLLKQYKSVLHPQNAFNTTLRHTLIQLYGRAEGYTFELLPDILLERKIELCEQILKVVDVLKPGKNRFRAMILYELHVPMMLFARNRFQYGEIDKDSFKEKMQEVANILSEAVTALLLEDPDSVEGSIGQIGANSLEQLKESIDML